MPDLSPDEPVPAVDLYAKMTAAAAGFAVVILPVDLLGSKPPFESSGYLIALR